MIIEYKVKLLTPVITAETGTIGKEIDVEVKKDINGKSYYSAKHIKGIFRAKVLEFKNALGENGEEFNKKYFGSEGSNISKIRFSNLKIENEEEKQIGSRYGLKINRKTKVAEDNSLFNYEFVKSKNIYSGELEIDETIDRKDLEFLLASFLHVDRIGGLKSRGLGRVEISFTSFEKENIEFKEENNKFDAVKVITDKISKISNENQKSNKLGEIEKYSYEITIKEPLVIQGRINKNEVEIRNSLQSSTIRGALIQYGIDKGYEPEDLLKISIAEVKKYVNNKEEFKLASGFETKYPVKDSNKKKVDKAISIKKDWKVNNNGDEEEIKLERGSLSLLRSNGTEISIKINEKTRTTEEGHFFSTEYIDFEKKEDIKFKGEIEIPKGLFEVDKEYEIKIGKYKSKGFGKVNIGFTKIENKDVEKKHQELKSKIKERIDKLNKQIEEDFNLKENIDEKIFKEDKPLKSKAKKLITFDFLSDMILPFNQIKNVGEEIMILFDLDEKNKISDKLALNKRRTFVNVEKLRGYNIINNTRKMDEIVITQGSVISYCIDEKEIDNILENLLKIEEKGIGLRRNEGFGRVRICSKRENDK